MQLTNPPESVASLSTEAKCFFINLHEPLRFARFTPTQHILLMVDPTGSTRIELSYSASRILEMLIANADKIVSREEIFAFAWTDRVVSQNSLNQAISSIRDLIGDDELRTIIQTVPRRGYRFNSQFLGGTATSIYK